MPHIPLTPDRCRIRLEDGSAVARHVYLGVGGQAQGTGFIILRGEIRYVRADTQEPRLWHWDEERNRRASDLRESQGSEAPQVQPATALAPARSGGRRR
jgi:hypothetical protein